MSIAWQNFKQHSGLLIAIMLTYFLSWVILEVLVIYGQGLGFWWWLCCHLGFFYVFAGLTGGFTAMSLAIVKQEAVQYQQLFSKMASAPHLLILNLLSLFAITMATVLLIIPGLYIASRLLFLNHTLIDKNISIQQIFQATLAMTEKQQGLLLKTCLFLLVFNLVGASVLGLGLLVTVPISSLVIAYYYDKLANSHIIRANF